MPLKTQPITFLYLQIGIGFTSVDKYTFCLPITERKSPMKLEKYDPITDRNNALI
jgi:hypothetical protein